MEWLCKEANRYLEIKTSCYNNFQEKKKIYIFFSKNIITQPSPSPSPGRRQRSTKHTFSFLFKGVKSAPLNKPTIPTLFFQCGRLVFHFSLKKGTLKLLFPTSYRPATMRRYRRCNKRYLNPWFSLVS